MHFHFTDNHASWINPIELWFRILSSPAASHESSGSAGELVKAIQAFVEVYGENAQPFQWRKVGVREGEFGGLMRGIGRRSTNRWSGSKPSTRCRYPLRLLCPPLA